MDQFHRYLIMKGICVLDVTRWSFSEVVVTQHCNIVAYRSNKPPLLRDNY